MATFDELSVDIAADTADFQAGVSMAEENALDLSLSLRRLGAAASSAEGEVDSVGRSALTSSAAFTTLAANAGGARAALTSASGAMSAFRLASLSTSVATFTLAGGIVGTLIPALTALLSTLVPLAATLGGVATAATAVAGAFGAVVGSGLLAFGQKRAEQNEKQLEQVQARIEALETLQDEQGSLTESQQKELEQLEEQEDKLEDATQATGALELAFARLQDQLAPIIADFGRQFVPLIEDAIAALPGLTRSIIQALGSLDPFRRALRDFGGVAQRVLPQIVSRFADLARNSLPVLRNIGQFLLNNGADIFNGIISTTKEVAPLLRDLGTSFADILPEVKELGTTVLNTLLPPLSDSADGVGDFVSSINEFMQSEAFAERLRTVKDIFQDLKPEIRLVAGALLELTDPETLEGLGSILDGLFDLFIVASQVVDVFVEAFRLLDALDADKLQTAAPGSQSPYQQATTTPQQNATGGQGQNVTVVNRFEGDSGMLEQFVKEKGSEVLTEQELATIRGTGGNQRP